MTEKDKEVKIINLFNNQGQAFEDILKASIKHFLSSGNFYQKDIQSKKQIVIKNWAKEEDFDVCSR